eukprot:Gb_29269 [translate_table: standard]
MGYTKDQLLARLEELGIAIESYTHPVVMTVEAQAKHIGHLEGGHAKNLFLKDKKHRLYIISALTTTNVDLKVLSQRLGLGKGGLRMASEEILKEVLQVPLGCVTPFALINESARSVALLLDQGFRTQKRVFFHPLSNDMTISLTTNDLDKFLMSIGKESAYVDLEAVVSVGKDQLPDLAVHVPTEIVIVSNLPQQQEADTESGSQNVIIGESGTTKHIEKVNTESKSTKKAINLDKKGADTVRPTAEVTDVRKLVNSILDKTTAAVLSEITAESVERHGKDLGPIVAAAVRERLIPDLESLIMLFKNAAYTQGFSSGIGSQSLPK